jgi:hypothetical protein
MCLRAKIPDDIFLHIASVLLFQQRFSSRVKPNHGRTGLGGGGRQAPSLLGKPSQSGNIRFTVGQYWLIIKINGTNSVNFVENVVNFVGNMLSNRNFS